MNGKHITRRRILGTASGLMLMPVGLNTSQESELSFGASPIIGAEPLDNSIAFVGRGGGGALSLWGVGLFDLREERMRWWVDTENRMNADLIITDGAIISTSDQKVVKINADSGRVPWDYKYQGQLRNVVQVGSNLLLVGNVQSEATVTQISIHDGEANSEYRFPEFGEVQLATGRGIKSVAIASDRYVGILDSSDGSISWGVGYDATLEWVYPIAPNILVMVLDSRLIFVWEDGYTKEIEIGIPRIWDVVASDNQNLYVYGSKSIACIDWSSQEILWQRQLESRIASLTPDRRFRNRIIVATREGNIFQYRSSGERIKLAYISGSADLGVYYSQSYFVWGNSENGITLLSSSFESVDDPIHVNLNLNQKTLSRARTGIVRSFVAGFLMLIGLTSLKQIFRFNLEDGRPFGRFAVGERRFAALLALIGGTFGAHKFYQGRDIAYLSVVFFWTGLPTLLGVFESIKYLRFTDQEYQDHLDHLAERYLHPEDDD
jgi:TM2 domain-containing membrane protein YozV